VSFFARIIAFYEELFEKGGSLEFCFCWFLFWRASSFHDELFDLGGE
jgi:hypothetical protein